MKMLKLNFNLKIAQTIKWKSDIMDYECVRNEDGNDEDEDEDVVDSNDDDSRIPN